MIFGQWFKKRLPKSLLGRSILILAIPILLIQTLVGYIFIDRLYGDVTIAKTSDVAREINFILSDYGESETNDTLLYLQAKAAPLEIDVTPALGPTSDALAFIDLSGRYLIPTLHDKVANVTGVDLIGDDGYVNVFLTHDGTPYLFQFSRHRASAANPHQLLVAGTLASFFFISIAVLFLRNQVKPIRLLAKAAEAFGKGDNVPFSPSGAAEVRQAGHAFISMKARIERHLEQRTAMLSGVSHDLRTPLTRMKLSISLMESDEQLEDLKGDVVEMQNMLDEFLAFTRGDSGEEISVIDPAVFAKSLIRDQRRADHPVTLEFAGISADRIEFKCRKQALTRAINNLLSNAARHGENTTLTVKIVEKYLSFIVEDDGPGIPKADREDALKPFERLDAARNQNKGTGSGLGLAIVSDIARSHGGKILLSHSTRLGGLRAEILIPR
jgi:two-component system osmolarity sensor histidine kinase EnvZ